jgi:hypothetical protein
LFDAEERSKKGDHSQAFVERTKRFFQQAHESAKVNHGNTQTGFHFQISGNDNSQVCA